MNNDFNNFAAFPDTPVAPEKKPAGALDIISMIFGIISVLPCCLYYFSGLTSIPAIILAIIAKKKGSTSCMAKAGLIMGIVGLVISIIVWIAEIVYAVIMVVLSGM